MRRLVIGSSLLILVIFGAVVFAFGTGKSSGGERVTAQTASEPALSSSPSSPPPPSPSPSPALPVLRAPSNPSSIKVSGATLFGWALMDTATGQITGSSNDETIRNTTESMIKGWIAADYLRRKSAGGGTPSKKDLDQITLMIDDSNNQAAQTYYEYDGQNASIDRLIKVCGLHNVTLRPFWWSYTLMSPADAVRYGNCLRDGRAAGPKWTPWLLGVMQRVRGGVADQISDTVQGGRWGIIDGLPKSLQPALSMKNGWTDYKDGWHVNCLGIEPGWVLNVMIRTNTLQHAADDCAYVTRQMVVTS